MKKFNISISYIPDKNQAIIEYDGSGNNQEEIDKMKQIIPEINEIFTTIVKYVYKGE